MNIDAELKRRDQQYRQEGYARTLAHIVMAEHEFAWIEGAMRRAEAHGKIKAAVEHAAATGNETRERIRELEERLTHAESAATLLREVFRNADWRLWEMIGDAEERAIQEWLSADRKRSPGGA